MSVGNGEERSNVKLQNTPENNGFADASSTPAPRGMSRSASANSFAIKPFLTAGMPPFMFAQNLMPFSSPFMPVAQHQGGLRSTEDTARSVHQKGRSSSIASVEEEPTIDEPTPESLRQSQDGSLKRRFHSCPDLPHIADRTEKRPSAPLVPLAPMQEFSKPSAGRIAGGNNSLRSITSCPDMMQFASGNPADDKRRQKRLARNRASARLRRLRKKNLVDTFEAEAAILEYGVGLLESHMWGAGQGEQLAEALAVPASTHVLADVVDRAVLTEALLEQQQQQMQELWADFVDGTAVGLLDGTAGSANQDMDQACDKLQAALGDPSAYGPGLVQPLDQVADEGLELLVLHKVAEVLCAGRLAEIPHLKEMEAMFDSLLNAQQKTKSSTWAALNAQAIEMLDFTSQPHQQADSSAQVVFQFGSDYLKLEGSDDGTDAMCIEEEDEED